ncbi:hypothetical protein Tco_0466526 [Tanacetum coccineum]
MGQGSCVQEINKDCTVADKLQFSVISSIRRSVKGGVESSQLALLQTYIEGTLLSYHGDGWAVGFKWEKSDIWVQDVRILLDEFFLPESPYRYSDGEIPRTCSSVADWLRISSALLYAVVESINGRPLVHMLCGLLVSIPSD